MRSTLTTAIAVVFLLAVGGAPASAEPGVDVGPPGTSLMHGDLASTDSTPHPGPGRGARLAASSVPGGACAATFLGRAGVPISLCTQFFGQGGVAVPTVTLFHPRTAAVLARLPLTKGGLLGGVYGYLDASDRVVVADGSGAIVRVAHRGGLRAPRLVVEERVSLAGHLPRGDTVTGLAPDYQGRVWFVTTNGVVGTVTPTAGRPRIASVRLRPGEQMGNGLSVRPAGVSVLTTHALYEMTAGVDGKPRTRWRRAYDRGSARKPGQLTWGSGTTPTYFGPGGDAWVAIVDNADRHPDLLVYRSDDGSLVCRMRAFRRSGQGTENSIPARGNTLVIPSTYGYQYPPQAETGRADPPAAPFIGGSTRVDVSESGCRRVWENTDRIATLPRLAGDGIVYALGYGPHVPGVPQQFGPVYLIGSDFLTGRRVVTLPVGNAPLDEPLELTGTIGPDGTLWQATIGRMLRITRR
ncbi:hypothetical protein GOARA_031_00070 [Gordonia araii NBRC 100433]|uniref:Glucose/Sorbosone dehydrogenase domain-containing protein n=1 Tax=Gordonia araii NBRC 100433 TaxID=1073574 RepID=G7H007_9ACTN|nr:hypothetical protein [Gordonia araii]NNG98811.1 hypothetical protein [Gordonia araii NBRC 100433]GAB09182.1 hypothetical protein GOARA_031_00070 [Gordonia araii NBRC 100433]